MNSSPRWIAFVIVKTITSPLDGWTCTPSLASASIGKNVMVLVPPIGYRKEKLRVRREAMSSNVIASSQCRDCAWHPDNVRIILKSSTTYFDGWPSTARPAPPRDIDSLLVKIRSVFCNFSNEFSEFLLNLRISGQAQSPISGLWPQFYS